MEEQEKQRKLSHQALSTFAEEVFTAIGAGEEEARIVATHLVDASLRGVDSHGVVRIPVYVQGVQEGRIDSAALPEIIRETNTSALVDGHGGFGQVTASFATKIAADKAKKNGSSIVGVRNLNHVGTLAYYGRMLAETGLIGRLCTSGFPRAAPWGGRGKGLRHQSVMLRLSHEGPESNHRRYRYNQCGRVQNHAC